MKRFITVSISILLVVVTALSMASCEISLGNLSIGFGTTGSTPAESTPTGNTPAESTPTGNTPAESTPTGNTPSESTPTGNTPAESTPTGNTPAESTPAESTTAHSHLWQSEYTSDGISHWYKCNDCDEVTGLEPHKPNETWKCEVCGQATVKSLLVIESVRGESSSLIDLMYDCYIPTVVNVADSEKMPSAAEELLEYDGVILVNIANKDMPDGFDTILHTYVSQLGGSLLTVCGGKEGSDGWKFSTYTKVDMYGSIYQELLPVDIVETVLPMAVIFLIDNSGSMEHNMQYIISAVESGIDAMRGFDYVGIMGMADSSDTILPLTPRTNRGEIMDSLNSIIAGGSTIFSQALHKAGNELADFSDAANKHIVIISDGEISAEDIEETRYYMHENGKKGITLSFVGMNMTRRAETEMHKHLGSALSEDSYDFSNVVDLNELYRVVHDYVRFRHVDASEFYEFRPMASADSPIIKGVNADDIPTLDGFCFCALKKGAKAELMGEYSPIYACHAVGSGKVGSFMCDLSGIWSSEFINSDGGRRIVNNMIMDVLVHE